MPDTGEPWRFEDLKAATLDLFGAVTAAARRDSAAETLRRLAAAEGRLRDSLLTVPRPPNCSADPANPRAGGPQSSP